MRPASAGRARLLSGTTPSPLPLSEDADDASAVDESDDFGGHATSDDDASALSPDANVHRSTVAAALGGRPLSVRAKETADDAEDFSYNLYTSSSAKKDQGDSKLSHMVGTSAQNRRMRGYDGNLDLAGASSTASNINVLANVSRTSDEHVSLVPKAKNASNISSSDTYGWRANKSEADKDIMYNDDMGNLIKTNDGDVDDTVADVQTLFNLISQYKPETIEMQTTLRCFLPEYIPAIGDLEAMIKIPTPAFYPDGSKPIDQLLGPVVLDEPSSKQSDPAVLHYTLRTLAKASSKSSTVHAIDFASDGDDSANSKRKFDEWIESTSSPNWGIARVTAFTSTKRYPTMDTLMDTWDGDLEPFILTEIEQGTLNLGDIDLSLPQCVKLSCAILGIPIHKIVTTPTNELTSRSPNRRQSPSPSDILNKPTNSSISHSAIDSLHILFELYTSFQQNAHFSNGMEAPSLSQIVPDDHQYIATSSVAHKLNNAGRYQQAEGNASRAMNMEANVFAMHNSSLSTRNHVSVSQDQQILSIN